MKICFVGPAISAHLIKWCGWFRERGHELHVVSFIPGEIEGVQVHTVDVGVDPNGSDLSKLKYLLCGKKIRAVVNSIDPDIINVHYATSYGMAYALGGDKNYILSVWGSDIFDFPKKSSVHRAMLKRSLSHAGRLFSTSQAMADEAGEYTDRTFDITPFGVDLERFTPEKRSRGTDTNDFVIGTVKSLSDVYGIPHILNAAARIKTDYPQIPLKVRIAGSGPDEIRYREMARDLDIEDIVTWLGFISQDDAAIEWANMDVAVIPSESESFGVSAVEAQASQTPVIISDVPGLMEATVPGRSSVVIARGDVDALVKEIVDLYEDPQTRLQMGQAGREFVQEHYELDQCFSKIEALFFEYLGDK